MKAAAAKHHRAILRAYAAGEDAAMRGDLGACPYADPAFIAAWGQGFSDTKIALAAEAALRRLQRSAEAREPIFEVTPAGLQALLDLPTAREGYA